MSGSLAFPGTLSVLSHHRVSKKRLNSHSIHDIGTKQCYNFNRYSTRRFGSNGDGNFQEIDSIKAPIFIMNEQSTYDEIESYIPHINRVLEHIRDILGYPNYEVVLALVDDPAIQELNNEFLGKNRPTDILSFPFDDDVIIEPGVLALPELDIPDCYCLGDMMISVPYVMRRAEEDMKELASVAEDQIEKERGISGIMSTMPTVEERISALLVHGMLHLVGYDHIEDDDYELMVAKEEEVWKELQGRLKVDNDY